MYHQELVILRSPLDSIKELAIVLVIEYIIIGIEVKAGVNIIIVIMDSFLYNKFC